MNYLSLPGDITYGECALSRPSRHVIVPGGVRPQSATVQRRCPITCGRLLCVPSCRARVCQSRFASRCVWQHVSKSLNVCVRVRVCSGMGASRSPCACIVRRVCRLWPCGHSSCVWPSCTRRSASMHHVCVPVRVCDRIPLAAAAARRRKTVILCHDAFLYGFRVFWTGYAVCLIQKVADRDPAPTLSYCTVCARGHSHGNVVGCTVAFLCVEWQWDRGVYGLCARSSFTVVRISLCASVCCVHVCMDLADVEGEPDDSQDIESSRRGSQDVLRPSAASPRWGSQGAGRDETFGMIGVLIMGSAAFGEIKAANGRTIEEVMHDFRAEAGGKGDGTIMQTVVAAVIKFEEALLEDKGTAGTAIEGGFVVLSMKAVLSDEMASIQGKAVGALTIKDARLVPTCSSLPLAGRTSVWPWSSRTGAIPPERRLAVATRLPDQVKDRPTPEPLVGLPLCRAAAQCQSPRWGSRCTGLETLGDYGKFKRIIRGMCSCAVCVLVPCASLVRGWCGLQCGVVVCSCLNVACHGAHCTPSSWWDAPVGMYCFSCGLLGLPNWDIPGEVAACHCVSRALWQGVFCVGSNIASKCHSIECGALQGTTEGCSAAGAHDAAAEVTQDLPFGHMPSKEPLEMGAQKSSKKGLGKNWSHHKKFRSSFPALCAPPTPGHSALAQQILSDNGTARLAPAALCLAPPPPRMVEHKAWHTCMLLIALTLALATVARFAPFLASVRFRCWRLTSRKIRSLASFGASVLKMFKRPPSSAPRAGTRNRSTLYRPRMRHQHLPVMTKPLDTGHTAAAASRHDMFLALCRALFVNFFVAWHAGRRLAAWQHGSDTLSASPDAAAALELLAGWHFLRITSCYAAQLAWTAMRQTHTSLDLAVRRQLGGAFELYYLLLLLALGTKLAVETGATDQLQRRLTDAGLQLNAWPALHDSAYMGHAGPASGLGGAGITILAFVLWHVLRVLCLTTGRKLIRGAATCNSSLRKHFAHRPRPRRAQRAWWFRHVVAFLCISCVVTELGLRQPRAMRKGGPFLTDSAAHPRPRLTRDQRRARRLAVVKRRKKVLLALRKLARSFDPYVGKRVGEASKPGPGTGSDEPPDDFRDAVESDREAPELCGYSDDGDDSPREWPESDSEDEQPLSDAAESDSTVAPRTAGESEEGWHERIIPPWDAKLPQEQISAWRTAEGILGIKTSVKSWLAAKRKRTTAAAAKSAPPLPAADVDYAAADCYGGPLEGFYFGKRDDKLGYHRCNKPSPPRAILLAEELDLDDGPAAEDHAKRAEGCTEHQEAAAGNKPRRRRNEEGKRIRGKSRRWQALRGTDSLAGTLQGAAASEIGWRPPKGSGMWAVDSGNTNSWRTGVRQVLGRTSADITLLQETKQRATRLAQAKRQAERLGWRAHLGPALVTAAKGTSGGVAVASRKGLGSIDHQFIAEGFQHRIGAAWVGAVVKGGVHVFSVYLKDGEGLGDTNSAILTRLAAAIGTVRGPWIIGGDWNLTPKALTDSQWPSIVKGVIHAPHLPTCNASTYDYFVVSQDLSDAVVGVRRLSDGGCNPHWTVRLYLHGAARAKAVRKLVRPDAIPGVLPHGPVNKQASREDTDTGKGLASWYKSARAVWHSLLATEPGPERHRFRWEAAAGRTARPEPGASATSAILRAMARRLDDSIALLRKGTSPKDPRITANSAGNVKTCNSKQLRSPEVNLPGVRSWCVQAEKALSAGDAVKASQLLKTIKKKAQGLETDEAKQRQRRWVKALTCTAEQAKRHSGHGQRLSRLAFRWVKGVAGWSRSTVGCTHEEDALPAAEPGSAPLPDDGTAKGEAEPDGHPVPVPRSDQAEIEATAAAWAKLWESNKDYTPPCFDGVELDELDPITVDDIERAAASFPLHTGLGVDNFSPRAVLRLPHELIQGLADILNEAEQAGCWDEALELVLIVLLPKDDGGHRPIGLFPSVIRIWMRVRSGVARDWERETAGPEFYGCTGRGAQRAAWLAAYEAESATAKGADHAAALLDLVKAFEMVPHAALVSAAREHGFSLKVLRLSLAAYRIARTVGVDGVYSKEHQATRGITAGSGMATAELRLLLTDMVFLLRKAWPVALKLYVDDLTISATGEGLHAANTVGDAADFAVRHLRGLGLEVSVKKSVATANRPRVLSTILARCKTGALKAASHTKLLGTAYAAGGRRCVQNMLARMVKVQKLVNRVQQLARLGISAIEYVRSAAVPAMLYGVEIFGMSDTMLADATRIAAAAISAPTAGKNPVLVMHAASVHSEAVNPTVMANVGPVKAWSTAWWDGWAPPGDLSEAYKRAKRDVDTTKPLHWQAVKGPVGAMVATCARLKWRSEDGRVFLDDLGEELDTRLDSPEVFANAAKRSATRLCLDMVTTELPATDPHYADARVHSAFGAQNERSGGRRTVLVNLTATLRPLYRGSLRLQEKLPQWTPQCRAYLTSAVNGGQWSQGMKSKLPRFEGTTKCQLCHEEEGTLWHRHNCKVTKPLQGWTPFGPGASRFIHTLTEPRARLLQVRGVLMVRIPIARPQTPTNGWQWLTDPPDGTDDSLKWVIDGSRKYASHWSLATTGCGVAVLNREGSLVAYATATPPPWVRTAGAAEAWALFLTLQHGPCIPDILTDCLALLHAAKAGPAAARKGRNTDARIWGLISEVTGGSYKQLASRLVWMPAHTRAAEAERRAKSNGRALTTAEWRANQLADVLAKKGAVETELRSTADKLIKDASNALLQSAARLGTVTRAANCHEIEFTNPDGTKGRLTKRDSTSIPQALLAEKTARAEVKAAEAAAAKPPEPPPATAAAPLTALTLAQAKARKRKHEESLRSAAQAHLHSTALAAAVASSSANSTPPALSAAARLEALRRRRGL